MHASTDSLLLFEYRPSGWGRARYWIYEGALHSLKQLRAPHDPEAIKGYVVPYRNGMSRRRLVFAGVDDAMHVDIGEGLVKLLPIPAEIGSNSLWRAIKFQTSAGSHCIHVTTPFWRYLLDDGMFPEDVEPVVHLMGKMTDSRRERFLTKFMTGKWPEGS